MWLPVTMQQQCNAEILHYSHFQLLQKLLQSYPTSTEIKFHKMIFGSPMSSNGDPVISKMRTSLQEKYNWLFNAIKQRASSVGATLWSQKYPPLWKKNTVRIGSPNALKWRAASVGATLWSLKYPPLWKRITMTIGNPMPSNGGQPQLEQPYGL